MPVRNPSDLASDPTLKEVIKRLPPYLHKFSGISGERLEWMRKLIVDSLLYFPQPSSFNDPLDCKIPPRFDASVISIEQF